MRVACLIVNAPLPAQTSEAVHSGAMATHAFGLALVSAMAAAQQTITFDPTTTLQISDDDAGCTLNMTSPRCKLLPCNGSWAAPRGRSLPR